MQQQGQNPFFAHFCTNGKYAALITASFLAAFALLFADQCPSAKTLLLSFVVLLDSTQFGRIARALQLPLARKNPSTADADVIAGN